MSATANNNVKSGEENPWIEIWPGIKRRTHVHGRTMYQMIAHLDAGSHMPEHQHAHELIVHILSGRMRLS
jgi:quercetin dioxygenase-like cupin family protein